MRNSFFSPSTKGKNPFTLSLSKGGAIGHSCFDKLSTNGLSEQHWVGKARVKICLLKNGLLNKSIEGR